MGDKLIGPHLIEFRARLDGDPRWNLEARRRVYELERGRVQTHARLFGVFLARDEASRDVPSTIRSYGAWTPLDYFEPEYACADDKRIPSGVIGPGPKFVCGPTLFGEPCAALSVGVPDGLFEAAAHRSAPHCAITLADKNIPLPLRFEARAYAANLTSIPRSLGNRSLAWLKIDVPDYELTLRLLQDLDTLCRAGFLPDHLNVAFHLGATAKPADLYRIFSRLRHHCSLLLHHKERHSWRIDAPRHCDFSWVSFRHARRSLRHAAAESG